MPNNETRELGKGEQRMSLEDLDSALEGADDSDWKTSVGIDPGRYHVKIEKIDPVIKTIPQGVRKRDGKPYDEFTLSVARVQMTILSQPYQNWKASLDLNIGKDRDGNLNDSYFTASVSQVLPEAVVEKQIAPLTDRKSKYLRSFELLAGKRSPCELPPRRPFQGCVPAWNPHVAGCRRADGYWLSRYRQLIHLNP